MKALQTLFCKRDEAAATCLRPNWMPLRRPRKNPREDPRPEIRENRMLDSVRLRLTVWYTAAVAVVLILLASLTYFLYARNIAQRTDGNLVELTDAFATTFNAELPAEIGSDAPQKAAREAMLEHRFRGVVFVFLDERGQPLLSSLDLPAGAFSMEHLTSEFFVSPGFLALSSLVGSPRPFRTIHAGWS